MADRPLETVESNRSSIAFPMSELPERRIDAPVGEVAPPGMPEQSEVEGGYNPAYAHFAHLPLLSLFSDKANALLKKRWDHYVRESNRTAGPVSSANTALAMMHFELNILVRFTRWTIPAAAAADLGQGNVPWFVDMLETYYADPNSKRAKFAKVAGNVIGVRSGLPGEGKITLKFLDFEPKVVKAQKHWGTKYKVKELCEALVLVDGTAEVHMEIIARIQRMCTVTESLELVKRFDKEWHVPVLRP
jgi:hypothetical protein